MTLSRPNRHIYEYLIWITVIIMVFFLVSSNIYYQNRLAKQKALFYQLEILRSSINLYKVINKVNPPALISLAKEVYKLPGDVETKRYIENAPIDRQGNIVDPFGSIYHYDPDTGWVRSITEDYEFW